MNARLLKPIALAYVLSTVVAGRAQPPNDACDRATVVGTLPFTDVVDTSDATRTPSDPTSCNAGGHTVWYRVKPPQTGRLCARTCGSDYDTVLVRVDETC